MNKTQKHIEEKIIPLVNEVLLKTFQGKIEILEREPATEELGLDLLIQIAIQDKKLKYYVQIKYGNVINGQVIMFPSKNRYINYPILLIASYITSEMAENFKQKGIEFIDTVGNMFINQPPLYIFVKGNKPPEVIKKSPKKAFGASGLKLIYTFLTNPGMENKNYREIAAAADVALGTIVGCIKELKELHYLEDMGKAGLRLLHKEALLQRWVTTYPEKLKPKLLLGYYKGKDDWWQDKILDPVKAQWGGEVAAAKLTQYLKPQTVTVYTTSQNLNVFLIEHRLVNDPNGNVELVERFWQPSEQNETVHPILVYADLLATGDERNIETAKVIHEQHIVQLVREN